MLKTSTIFTIKCAFINILNTVIISELISKYLKDNEFFTNEWLYSAYGMLLAYIIYIILIKNKIIQFSYNSRFNSRFTQPTIDLLRLSLLLFLTKIITNLLEHGIINLKLLWIYKTFLILISYFISDIILADFLIKFNNYQLLFYFICKVFLTNYLIILFLYNQFTIDNFIDRFSFLISYIFFEIIIKKIIII
jgi:hypothetical protein